MPVSSELQVPQLSYRGADTERVAACAPSIRRLSTAIETAAAHSFGRIHRRHRHHPRPTPAAVAVAAAAATAVATPHPPRQPKPRGRPRQPCVPALAAPPCSLTGPPPPRSFSFPYRGFPYAPPPLSHARSRARALPQLCSPQLPPSHACPTTPASLRRRAGGRVLASAWLNWSGWVVCGKERRTVESSEATFASL